MLIFLFTAVLIKPLYKAKYLDRWDSIESAYISDGRFLKTHGPHPQWQPLWYCGTRYDYIYPPAVRYGTALLSNFFIPAKAHHVYTALLYCLGIAGLYFFTRVMSGSRGVGWLAAAGGALVSPAYLLIRQVRVDTQHLAPWRFWVMVRYGEGPHIAAVALIPIALGCAYLALRAWRPKWLACAALFSAWVALTNFYGSTGLGILYPLLVWSVWAERRDRWMWARAAAIPALAYALSAFWLTPSYFHVTMVNLKWFSPPGDPWMVALNVVLVLAFALVAWRLRAGAYATFLCGSLLILGVNVLGRFWFGVRALAEPDRLTPEFDLILILAAVEGLRRLWHARWRVGPWLAAAVVLLAAGAARHYVRHAWDLCPLERDYKQRPEYRMPEWIAQNMPQSRTFASGSMRFWWNTWRDTAQVGGACDRGVLNQRLIPAMTEVTAGSNPETAVRWLQALGADAVVVPDAHSQEPYHDFVQPYKFAGVLPAIYDDHQGNVIYKVPRRYASLARVVDTAALRAVPQSWNQTDLGALRAYTAVVEQGPEAETRTDWAGTDELLVHAPVAAGQAVLVQVTYDPAWHAYSGGKELAVRPDPVEFSLIEAPPGEQDIRFVFETPLANRVGSMLGWLALTAIAFLIIPIRGPGRRHLLDALLIVLLTAVLIEPLHTAKYLARWDSIESTFISDARFLQAHWPHPQWQPLWYCGTRFDYVYPPLLRYGTALLARFYLPVEAYHLYTALLYCLGIAGVYFLGWVLWRSRASAWLAAAATALVSPTYLFVSEMRIDSGGHIPWRLWVLTRYGEGPHISAVALLPFALGFAWLAIGKRRPTALAAAAVCCALVALHNFYGATSLAIFYPILVWSLWVTQRDRRVWLWAAAIPALAYGLAAFWLTPSYLRVTLENLHYVSLPGSTLSRALLAVALAAFMAVTLRFASRKPERAPATFIGGCLLVMGMIVLGYYHFKFRVMGDPRRFVPELDLAMILASVAALRQAWRWPGAQARVRVVRAAVVLVVAAALGSAWQYVGHAWVFFPRAPDYRQRVEYRAAEWVHQHLPGARTFSSGSIRFWWDTWHDLAEVGGGSEQGLLNPQVEAARWEICLGQNPETAVRWLQALGADAVVVPDAHSQETYHDFAQPYKFAGVLPAIYDDHQGNVIYRVPRRYPSLARVVDTAALRTVPQGWAQNDLSALRAYTAVVEQGPEAETRTDWVGTDELRVHARVTAGQAVLVQVTYDPAWHAYSTGKELTVRRDPVGFSLIEAPAGEQDLQFVFKTPLENRVGWVLALLAGLVVIGLLTLDYVHRKAA